MLAWPMQAPVPTREITLSLAGVSLCSLQGLLRVDVIMGKVCKSSSKASLKSRKGLGLEASLCPTEDAAALSYELRLVVAFVFTVQLLPCSQYVCLPQPGCSAVTEGDGAQRAVKARLGWPSPLEKALLGLSRAICVGGGMSSFLKGLWS